MKSTILLVDDNTQLLEAISTELEISYHVITATDGNKAIALLENEPVHLIISDVMMPGLDGFDFCRYLKNTVEYNHIPIILLTAKNSLKSKITGLELGADAYIEKPFDFDHLLAQIANLLESRNKLRQSFLQFPLIHLKSMVHSKADERFVEKVNNAILLNIGNQAFDVDELAALMCISRASLFRKIRAVAGITPTELITITRLKKAAALLAEGGYRVYEVSDMLGFSSPSSFGRSFYRQFGITPKEFQMQKQEEKRNK